MKDSEKYKLALIAVINSTDIDFDNKLEVITLLMTKRQTALWIEAKKEEEQDG